MHGWHRYIFEELELLIASAEKSNLVLDPDRSYSVSQDL